MKKILLLLAFFAFIGSQSVYAQSRVITGSVTNEKGGSTIPGVQVIVKGTTIGTTTNLDGMYTLSIPGNATILQFTFIGMKTTEIEIGNQSTINLAMEEDLLLLDEVIVVAYGTATKESFSGSVSVVKSEQLVKRPTSSLAKALQAQSPGVQVLSASGASGSDATIRIRGLGSITSSQNPLWVVDGVALWNDMTLDDNGNPRDKVGGLRPNLEDIETITVLKDAAASSLYGSRAANGVVLVTTKKGKAGKTKFTLQYKNSFSNRTRAKFELLNAGEFMQQSWAGIKNYADDKGQTWLTDAGYSSSADYAHQNLVSLAGKNPYSVAQPYDDNGNLVSGAQLMFDNDWFDDIHQTGITKQIDISASGGNDNTKFYISGGYYDQTGIVDPDFYEKFTAQMNLSSKVNDKLEIGINSNFRHSTTQGVYETSNGTSTGYAAYRYPNNVPLYELDDNFQPVVGADGNLVYNYTNKVAQDYNPIALTKLNPRGSKSTRFTLSPYLKYEIIPGLVFKSLWSAQMYFYDDFHFENPYHGDGKSVGGRSSKEWRESRLYSSTNTLTYNKTINDRHQINVLAGYEFEKYSWHNIDAGAKQYSLPISDELSVGGSPNYVTSGTSENSMISYLAKVQYNLDKKYYFGASIRRDGSSRFSPKDNRNWGNFYSVEASWRLLEEPFIKNLDIFDNLKLRTSYGTSGNNNIPEYQYLPLYTVESSYMELVGLTHTQLANDFLEWEKNKVFNIGIDFALFNNKLDMSIEYFNRISDDLIMNRPLPLSTGWVDKMENIGALKNAGFEFYLRTLNTRTDDLTWTTDFNLSFYTNKITALSQDEIIDGNRRWVIGNSLKVWYMREWAGVNAANGAGQWWKDILDANGDPTGERELTEDYDEADRYELGESLPKYYGGMTNTVSYKDFTFSATLYFSVGAKIYDGLEQRSMHDGANYGYQLNKNVLNAWTPENTNTDVPRYVYNNQSLSDNYSSRFLHDGSFLRLSNVSINYSIPKNIVAKSGMESADVYVTGDNLFVWTSYQGNDPEQGINGNNGFATIPNIRTITFGVRLGF